MQLIDYQKSVEASSQAGQGKSSTTSSPDGGSPVTDLGDASRLPVDGSGFAPVIVENGNSNPADTQASGPIAIPAAQTVAEATSVPQSQSSSDTSSAGGFRSVTITETAAPVPIQAVSQKSAVSATPAPAQAPPLPSRPTSAPGISNGQRISNQALHDAWPTTGHGKSLSAATPDFRAEFNAQHADPTIDGASDCGEVVAIEVKASGVDPAYYRRGTYHQMDYLKAHPEKWQLLSPRTPPKPGDIFINGYHSFIYVGPQSNGHDTVAASLHGHVLEPSDLFYSENNVPFSIFRAIDTASAPATPHQPAPTPLTPNPIPVPTSASSTVPAPDQAPPPSTTFAGFTLPGGGGFTSIGEGFRIVQIVSDPTPSDTGTIKAPALPPSDTPTTLPADGGGFTPIPIVGETTPTQPAPTLAPPVVTPTVVLPPPVQQPPTTATNPPSNPNVLPHITGNTAVNSRMVSSVRFYMGQGYTRAQASGIVANFWWESSGDNPTVSQHRGGAGRGEAQWSVNGRWQRLLTYARDRGKSPYDLTIQNEFVMLELHTTYAHANATLKAASTPEEAAYVFERDFEQAGAAKVAERQAYAKTIDAAFAKAGVPNVTAQNNPALTPPAPQLAPTPAPSQPSGNNNGGSSTPASPDGSGGQGSGTSTQPGGSSSFAPTIVNVSMPSDNGTANSPSNGNPQDAPKNNTGTPPSTGDTNTPQSVHGNSPDLMSKILRLLS